MNDQAILFLGVAAVAFFVGMHYERERAAKANAAANALPDPMAWFSAGGWSL